MPPRSNEELLKLQADSRNRHSSVAFMGIHQFIDRIEKAKNVADNQAELAKIMFFGVPKRGEKRVVEKPLKKIDWKKVAASLPAVKETTDDRKPFQRPPAIYTNTSPYGIAAEMLMEQLKDRAV